MLDVHACHETFQSARHLSRSISSPTKLLTTLWRDSCYFTSRVRTTASSGHKARPASRTAEDSSFSHHIPRSRHRETCEPHGPQPVSGVEIFPGDNHTELTHATVNTILTSSHPRQTRQLQARYCPDTLDIHPPACPSPPRAFPVRVVCPTYPGSVHQVSYRRF